MEVVPTCQPVARCDRRRFPLVGCPTNRRPGIVHSRSRTRKQDNQSSRCRCCDQPRYLGRFQAHEGLLVRRIRRQSMACQNKMLLKGQLECLRSLETAILTRSKIRKLGMHVVFHVHKLDERVIDVKVSRGPEIFFTIYSLYWSRLLASLT